MVPNRLLAEAIRLLWPDLERLFGAAWPATRAVLDDFLRNGALFEISPLTSAVFDLFDGVPEARSRLDRALDALTDQASPRSVKSAAGEARTTEARHVNVCISELESKAVHPPEMSLAARGAYVVRLSIGALADETLVRSPEAFPAEHLPRSDQGHWLEIIVLGKGFTVTGSRRSYFLPATGPGFCCRCTPGESVHRCAPADRDAWLDVPLTAPATVGKVSFGVGVYHEKNLVQSLRVHVTVAEDERFSDKAYADVEYTLSSGLKGLDSLPARNVNVTASRGDDGEAVIVVNGRDEPVIDIHLSDAQIGATVRAARECLRTIHLEEWGGSLGTKVQRRSRYDRYNAKAKKDYLVDLTQLATLGWRLYTAILGDRPDDRRELRAQLASEFCTIQVSRPGGADVIFPWSLVYDIPIELGAPEKLKLCPWLHATALVGRTTEEMLSKQLADDVPRSCPAQNKHERNTLCPFGFWGIHHVIELPPSVPSGSRLATELVHADPLRMVLGVSLELDPRVTADHLANLKKALGGLTLAPCDDRASVERALSQPQLEAVYFYCHGRNGELAGSKANLPYLEVGESDRIAPDDIVAWFDDGWPEDHWRKAAPLVFINGCHTTDMTPESLTHFVDAFAGAYAAGVIGTECAMAQGLASEIAEMFWAYFHRGTPVGEAIRRLRYWLLQKGNLMGLAYTPYCSASLRLRASTPSQPTS